MTVKNPFPKPNHDPPPEIVCVINMKAWEVSEVVAAVLHLAQSVSKIQPIQDVTDHEALIRWVRDITDLAHSRVSDQGRIYDHVEAYIVNEIDDDDEIHKYPDVEAWEYSSDLTEARRFFKSELFSQRPPLHC